LTALYVSKLAQTIGAAGDLVPKEDPEIVTELPLATVPETVEMEGAAQTLLVPYSTVVVRNIAKISNVVCFRIILLLFWFE
jgi:hypothetical protein